MKRKRDDIKLSEVVLEVLALLILLHVFIISLSLVQVAEGAETPYMSFWHAPAKWLFNLLGLM